MSVREDVLAAVVTALEQTSVTVNASAMTKPTDLTVARHPERERTLDDLPIQDVWMAPERLDYDITGTSTRVLQVRVRSVVTYTTGSGDAALDDLLTWAELTLMQDETLGGVASIVELTAVDTPDIEERADKYAQAIQTFDITYLTKFGDPRSAP